MISSSKIDSLFAMINGRTRTNDDTIGFKAKEKEEGGAVKNESEVIRVRVNCPSQDRQL
jgi:hypothetical protein